jgi:translation initiation factor IF-1
MDGTNNNEAKHERESQNYSKTQDEGSVKSKKQKTKHSNKIEEGDRVEVIGGEYGVGHCGLLWKINHAGDTPGGLVNMDDGWTPNKTHYYEGEPLWFPLYDLKLVSKDSADTLKANSNITKGDRVKVMTGPYGAGRFGVLWEALNPLSCGVKGGLFRMDDGWTPESKDFKTPYDPDHKDRSRLVWFALTDLQLVDDDPHSSRQQTVTMSERKADSKPERKQYPPMQRPYTLPEEIFATKLLLLTQFGIKIPSLAGYTLDELTNLLRQKKEEERKKEVQGK